MKNCTPLSDAWHGRADIGFSVLRLDRCTDRAIGNKQFKLGSNLKMLRKGQRVLSFGGAWSNHLLALAQLTHQAGIKSVGVVRGDEGFNNEMLDDLRENGMQLHFVSRKDYKRRSEASFCDELCRLLNCDTWLPEGGSNRLAVSGCEDIAKLINGDAKGKKNDICTRIVLAVGTGATFAGLIRACLPQQHVTGIPVVADESVYPRIEQWLQGRRDHAQWSMFHGSLRRAYARPSPSLLNFIVKFHRRTAIALDPVYTGPALFAALSDEFIETLESGSRVVFVHTGGLAGIRGFADRFAQNCDPEAVRVYLDQVAAQIGPAN